jgi:hypothetical protein
VGEPVKRSVRLLRVHSSMTLLLLAVLIVPQSTLGQNRTANIQIAAKQAWPSFFSELRTAVRRRDRQALRKMLASDLLFSLGHHRNDHLEEAFNYWDANRGRGWKAFNRILGQGSAPQARWWNNGAAPGQPTRVAPAAANVRANIDRERIAWYAIFEFRPDGHWYCVIFQECCD